MPFVALTSLAKAEHEQKAIACGFDDYEEKLEHDRLKRKVQLWLDRSFERTVQR
jgi:CheY-like chemotaxis protein